MTKYTTCLSRHVIERLRPDMFPEKTCVISINEPESKDGDAVLHPNWYKVLRTRFWDVTRRMEQGISLAGHPDTPIDPITSEQAKEIAEFVKENEDCTIIVHCRAGISRSAAVAKVLMELGWEDIPMGFKVPPMVMSPTNVSRANVEVASQLRKHFGQLMPIGWESDGKDNSS